MTAPVVASGRDLRALAGIVSEDRADFPADGGLPESLLADLMGQIRCDYISLDRAASGRHAYSLLQAIPAPSDDELKAFEDVDPAHWEHWWTCRWDCQSAPIPSAPATCAASSNPADFYSARQWHSTGMYSDYHRPHGIEHELQLWPARFRGAEHRTRAERPAVLLPRARAGFLRTGPGGTGAAAPAPAPGLPGCRAAPPPVPRLTPRQRELLRLVAAGHTNTQIARHLGISEGTVGTHLENIYTRLNVSSRTAAVTRAFPDRVATHANAS